MGTLEKELQKIHECGIGVSILWLWDARLDLRLIHKGGVIVGTIREVAEDLPWLERAIKRHLPMANYEHAARPLPGYSPSTRFMPGNYTANREPIPDGGAQ